MGRRCVVRINLVTLILPPSPKYMKHGHKAVYVFKIYTIYLTLPEELLVRRQRVNSSP